MHPDAPTRIPPEATEAPLNGSAVHRDTLRARRLWHTLRSRNFGWLGAEVVAIFLGITFSFLFEEWRESRQEAQREKILLEKLASEIENKINELHSDRNDFLRYAELTRNLIGYSRELPLADSIRRSMVNIVQFSFGNSYFLAATPTYVALNNTEGHRLVRDTAVTRRLYTTFETHYATLSQQYTELERVKHQILSDHFRRRDLVRLLYDANELSREEVDNVDTKGQLLILLIQLEKVAEGCLTAAEASTDLHATLRSRIQRIE